MTGNKIYPKVSIIIPVWNPGQGIRRCVESLRGQTLEDIEIIFVDDCGTDGAKDIIRANAAEDPRIRIIENGKNMGAGASRNAAIEAAQGEYLAFVDADDYVDSDFMEVLYSKGKVESLDIVKGSFINELEGGARRFHSFNLNDAIQKGLKDGKPLFLLFHYEYQSALYHKRLFENPDVRYGLSRNAEDTTFLLKACHAAKSLGIDNRAVYHYRYQMSSASNSFSEDRLEARASALRDKAEYLSNYVEPNPYAVQYITRSIKDYLAMQRHVAKVGMEKEATQFLGDLREIAKEYPNIGKVKDMTILALVKYGVGLAERPYHSPWEVAQPEDYLDVVVVRTKFLMAHPEHYKEWPKLVSLSERFVKRMGAEGIPLEEIEWFKQKVNALWSRPPMLRIRLKYWCRNKFINHVNK